MDLDQKIFRIRTNPERTGRRVIKIDSEKSEYRINGDVPVILSELEFAVADVYITLVGLGLQNKDINDLFDKVRENGLKNAWKIIKLENNLSGQEFLKDLGEIPDFIK